MWFAGKVLAGDGGRLVLVVGMGVISSLEEVQSSRPGHLSLVWSDSSCLTCTSLALCPSDSAQVSHRRQVTSEEVTLVLNSPSFNGV